MGQRFQINQRSELRTSSCYLNAMYQSIRVSECQSATCRVSACQRSAARAMSECQSKNAARVPGQLARSKCLSDTLPNRITPDCISSMVVGNQHGQQKFPWKMEYFPEQKTRRTRTQREERDVRESPDKRNAKASSQSLQNSTLNPCHCPCHYIG